jgi:LysM repeat protein
LKFNGEGGRKIMKSKSNTTPWWIKVAFAAIMVFLGLEYTPVTVTRVAEAEATGSREVAGFISAAHVQPAAQVVATFDSTYTVKPGDQLLQKFGKQAKVVCELNKLANCDHIEVGQVLKLPAGVTPREVKPAVAEAKPVAKPVQASSVVAPVAEPSVKKAAIAKRVTQVYKPVVVRPVAVPMTNDAGEILYRRVGIAPLSGCGKRTIASISEEAWEVLGLSYDDRVYLREHADLANGPRIHFTENGGLHQIETDVRLEQVTFCRAGKAVAMGPMRTAWDATVAVYGERFVLPSSPAFVKSHHF